jgi:hypothetical protein
MYSENYNVTKRKIYLFTGYNTCNLGHSVGRDGTNPRQNSDIDTLNLIWLLSRKIKQRPDGDKSFYALKHIQLPSNQKAVICNDSVSTE